MFHALLAACRARGLHPDEIAALTYTQVAEMSGVALGPDGESPPDFYYDSLRMRAADVIRAEQAEHLWAARLSALQEIADNLSPDSPLNGYSITLTVGNRFELSWNEA